MISIAPAAAPAVLPDGLPPAPSGRCEAEGAGFATELALAISAGEPAAPRPASAPAPDDGIGVTMACPAPDRGDAVFEPKPPEFQRTRAADGAAPDVAAVAPRLDGAPPAPPLAAVPHGPHGPGEENAPCAPTRLPARQPAGAGKEGLRETGPPGDPPLPKAVASIGCSDGNAAGAQDAPGPAPLSPPSAAADDPAALIGTGPVAATVTTGRPDRTGGAGSEREKPPPANDAGAETAAPVRAPPADAEPPPRPQPGERGADLERPAGGGPTGIPADRPPASTGDAASMDRPPPGAPAHQPAPEAIVFAAAAMPPRLAGEPGRTGSGSAPSGPTARTSTTAAAGPPPQATPPGAKLREPAEAGPRPADAGPARDAAQPWTATPAEASKPAGITTEGTGQPTARVEATPRAFAQPAMPLEAPLQLQTPERSAVPAAAPAAAPAPARPAPAPPAQQIAPVLITLAAGTAGMPDRLMLTLDPRELGRIEVEVTREGERRVAIAVLAERPETLHLLMRDAQLLDRALAQAGVGTEGRSLAFDLGGSDSRRRRGGGPGAPVSPPSPQPGGERRCNSLSLLDIAI
jgi:hypothetical protein